MSVVENESQLVVEASRGSTAAFEALVISYEPRIRRMLYSMTHDTQLTQDLCQETFLAAYRALPRMSGENLHFAPWLYRIAVNLLRSEWRRKKHVIVLPFSNPQGSDDDFSGEPSEAQLISDEQQFEDRVVKQDLVRRVLTQLPESSSLCLLMDAEGFTYNEIAETLQESLSSVRSRLSRARQAFRRIYSSLDQEG
jgi:RNA polymerase sigma-70 factor, ECF subfamily